LPLSGGSSRSIRSPRVRRVSGFRGPPILITRRFSILTDRLVRNDRYRSDDLLLLRLFELDRKGTRARGTEIAVRLSAFILFCLGVQIVWMGKFCINICGSDIQNGQ
jgi:hypothetical protein